MAITKTTPSVATHGFIVNAVSSDASGCEEVLAAVAGKQIKIRFLSISSDAAISITIGEGETGGAVTTALIGPVPFGANQTLRWYFKPYLVLTAGVALVVDTSGPGNICIVVQGVIN